MFLIKITIQQLIQLGTDDAVLNAFIEQTNDTDKPVDLASLVGGKIPIEDLAWLSCVLCTSPEQRVKMIRCVKDCALINIELIKPFVTKRDYNSIVKFLGNDVRFASDAVRQAAIRSYKACGGSLDYFEAMNNNTNAARAADAVVFASAGTTAMPMVQRVVSISPESKAKVEDLLRILFTK